MATLQSRDGKWRAIVRRKGHKPQTRTFPTKSAARTWADHIERELSDFQVRGGKPGEDMRVAQLIDWRTKEPSKTKAVTSRQAGNEWNRPQVGAAELDFPLALGRADVYRADIYPEQRMTVSGLMPDIDGWTWLIAKPPTPPQTARDSSPRSRWKPRSDPG